MDHTDSPHRERLWTPWRMRYIAGDAREDGCIFCNRLAATNDVESLILHQGERSFVIMNLFPYNTGHVMLVPNRHAADLEALDVPTLAEMATLLPRLLTALRRVLGCNGFNIGLNLGSVAGAGVAEHLHQHVVPRWQGDANFMPIIAGTMVIPETIPSTYAKVRAELEHTLHGAERFDVVVVSDDDRPRLWLRDGRIPSVRPSDDAPVWRAALSALGAAGAEIVGWSGGTRAIPGDAPPGLVVRIDGQSPDDDWDSVPWETATTDSLDLTPKDRDTLRRVGRNLAPWIAPPKP